MVVMVVNTLPTVAVAEEAVVDLPEGLVVILDMIEIEVAITVMVEVLGMMILDPIL
jgi:hypothetical protein